MTKADISPIKGSEWPPTTPDRGLLWCKKGVVANAVNLDVAIAAHQASANEADAKIAIRVVIVAKLPTFADAQRQLQYLDALPLEAWPETSSYTADVMRDETLIGLRRNLAERIPRVERPPPGWFVYQIGRVGRHWDWDALMVDSDPNAEGYERKGRRFVWVAVVGKHRSLADAEATLQDMMGTRH